MTYAVFKQVWHKLLLAIAVIIVFIIAVTFGFSLMSEPNGYKILLGIMLIGLTLWIMPPIFNRIFGDKKHENTNTR